MCLFKKNAFLNRASRILAGLGFNPEMQKRKTRCVSVYVCMYVIVVYVWARPC